MRTKKFERGEMVGVCAAVSSGFMGKLAEIEVVSPTDGLWIEARWLTVIGIAYASEKKRCVHHLIVLLRDPLMLPRPAAALDACQGGHPFSEDHYHHQVREVL
jgi:hypothetical protein